MTFLRAPLVWRILLAAAAVFAVTMALLPHPPSVGDINDKYQHMTAFGTLTILYALAYPATPLLRIGERLSFMGALIEVFQSIPALHRDCDVMDWIADTFIIVVVLLSIRAGRARRAAAP
ncbi:hypothetical protein [Sphingomonas sp. Mn802worker]|uniref:hypothetical protein n=1 Tax=Sphingomonas sp. Mn802worker TaxID=629773 RepID=UPI0003725A8F|nr:hypothetical protein [Sphingomonas sp. Mn802worker]